MAAVPLGLIDASRLAKIPPKHHAEHEFCFHIHDSMLSMFHELARHQYPTIKLEFADPEELNKFQSSPDPITYFINSGNRDLAKRLTVGQAMMAVLADFFNFVYEGLIALEKRKFVVALALLRKPLKQNLLYLTIMLADDEAFFQGLENSPARSFGHPGIQDQDRREYFEKAKQAITLSGFIDPKLLHDIIFDLSFENGLAPLFDKATHLVTGRSQITTEDLNLNFIFKNPIDNDIYESIYRQLSYVLLYAMLLEISLFKKAGFQSKKLAQWFALTGLGSFNGLFGNGSCVFRSSMNRLLKPFLKCPHCDAPVKIRKSEAARFFTSHRLLCRQCRHEHDFPLFWLLSQSKWSMSDD